MLLVLPLGFLFLLFFNIALTDTLNDFWVNAYKIYERNSMWSLDVSKILYFNTLIVYNFIYLVPFLQSLTSLLLLFLSLKRHIRNAQLNSSSGDFSTEDHKRAMKMVMSFLLLFKLHVSSTLFPYTAERSGQRVRQVHIEYFSFRSLIYPNFGKQQAETNWLRTTVVS